MFTCDGTGFSTQHSFLMDEYLSSRWLGNITTTICREGFTCSLMALMYVSVRSLGSSRTMGSLTCNREYNDCDTCTVFVTELVYTHTRIHLHRTNPYSHNNYSYSYWHHSILTYHHLDSKTHLDVPSSNHITTTHTNPIPLMQHYPSSPLPPQHLSSTTLLFLS